MFDLPPSPVMQRAKGRAFASFALRGGAARLVDLSQKGSAKVMLPRVAGPVPEVVFLNTSGGLTGGDVLDLSLDLAPGLRLAATTQTAERAYSSNQGAAEVRFAARVGAGARLDWLPQETILFEGAHLSRQTRIDLEADASCLVSESLVLGRLAMGEELRAARLLDQRMICRQGRPVWADALHLDPEVLARRSSPVLLGGANAFGVVALVARGAEDAVAALRALPPMAGASLAVSGWDGRCLARVLAADGLALRKTMALIIKTLSARPLPRVWLSGGTI